MRTWTFTVSMCAHACALGAVIVAPLFATADLPDPHPPTLKGPVLVTVPSLPPPSSPKTASRVPVRQAFPIVEPNLLPDNTTTPIPDPRPEIGVPGGTGVPSDAFGVLGDPVTPPPVAPSPRDPAPVRVGGDIRPPTRIAYAAPVYPKMALAARVEGLVVLEAVIDEQGGVREVRVLRGHPLLDPAAIEAVSKWAFTPTQLNGTSVPVVMTVTVTFSLTK